MAAALCVTWAVTRLAGQSTGRAVAAFAPSVGYAAVALAVGLVLIAVPALVTRPVRASDLRRE